MNNDNISSNNKRIAKNTALLYFRMIIIMCVTLFTSRVILRTLGVENYGIYNVVGGIVAMFGFISNSLTTASQRFITFEIGKQSNGDISKVFSACVLLHLLIGLLIAVIAEPAGLWFINNKLMIPDMKISGAVWVFHFSILSMVIMFITVPYTALIVAHEEMKAFAYVSIIDAVLRLAVAYIISFFSRIDSLIMYGLLMLLAQMLISLCYILYCKFRFKNIKFMKQINRPLLIEMGNFASWSIMGNLAYITYTQGVNLLLGTFFSPVVNAARGIAVQVQSAVNSFVNGFQTAINPQITKNYASGNIDEMICLVFRSSRFSFYLLMILSIPVLLRTNDLLTLWLVDVPNYTISFVQIIILTTWINSIANPLIISVKATGQIKLYEMTVGGLMILILPISYLFLRKGYSPEVVFIIHLIIECIAMAFRIWNTKTLIGFSYKSYLKEVVYRIFTVALISLIVSYLISLKLPSGGIYSIVMFALSIVSSLAVIIIIGLDEHERRYIYDKLK